MRLIRLCPAIAASVLLIVACGSDLGVGENPTIDGGTLDGGSDAKSDATAPDGSQPAGTFSVGGTITGLLGTGLVLQNNAGDDLAIGANGAFAFATKLPAGAAFKVTIKTQPTAPAQTCTVSGDSGTIVAGNVMTVAINCAANTYTVGGTVTGLVGTGLTLQNNGGGDLVVNANGEFAFATPSASGAGYAITVKEQPGTPSQTCVVTNGTGTVGSTKVTDVQVVCTTNKYTVGGTVAGLSGSGLVLQVNGGETLPVSTSGQFTFPTAIDSGSSFEVTVSGQPTGPAQTCTVSGGTGTVGAGNVTSVTVNCATNKYTIGGTAAGLVGTAVLQNDGVDLIVDSNGSFAFPAPLDSGAAYSVTIKSQPGTPSQTCVLSNGEGTIGNGAVTNLVLSCVTNTFKVKANVTGLAGTGLVLRNNGGDDLAIAADGAFEFTTAVPSGQTYAVTVGAQPSALSQTCTVTNGVGTIGAADVTNVDVTCVTNSFTVGGAVAGLAGSGLKLQNNLGDTIDVPSGATGFTFPAKVISGGIYSVTISSQPSDPTQTCVVGAGSGTVTNGNVVSVNINCTTSKFAVGGSTGGLSGTGLVLQNNGGDDLTINGNGSFAFSNPVSSGQPYAVTVKTQPTNPSQTCVVTSGSGTVGAAAITSVSVQCTTDKFAIGGVVSGLTAAGLVLRNNNGDDMPVNSNGAFAFPVKITSGATYAVTVFAQPAGQYCAVANGSGTVTNTVVSNVVVNCVVAKTYNTQNFNGMTEYLLDQDTCHCCGSSTTAASIKALCNLGGYSTAVDFTRGNITGNNCYCWNCITSGTFASNCCSGVTSRPMILTVTCANP